MRALGIEPHDDPAMQRDQVTADAEAIAVTVQPRCADGRPAGIVAITGDTVEPMGWFAARHFELRLGHGVSPF